MCVALQVATFMFYAVYSLLLQFKHRLGVFDVGEKQGVARYALYLGEYVTIRVSSMSAVTRGISL